MTDHKDRTRIPPRHTDQANHGEEATVIRPAHVRSTVNNQQNQSDAAMQRKTPLNADRTRIRQGNTAGNESPLQQRGIQPTAQAMNPAAQQAAHSSAKNPHILKERFLLESVIGVGGMGIVYRAKDRLKVEAKDRDPYVAIKVLGEEFRTHPEAFITLQRESRKSQRISHPNTVKVYDFDRDGDVVFMTMEYMQGKPLDEMVRQYQATGLPQDDAWQIIDGMCQALIHAHAENIVHSDFKPGNVFVTDAGMAKVFDFGIARAVAQVDRKDGKHIDKTVFDAGNLGALTPAYASLEMLQGLKPDVRDDVYALGCVIYETLTGHHPFNKIPADEAAAKGMKPERIAWLKKRQWKALERSLSFRREERIESVEELHDLLFTSAQSPVKYIAASLLLIISTVMVFILMDNESVQQIDEASLRNEITFKVRYDLYQSSLEKLIADPTFSTEWEQAVWEQAQGMKEILQTIIDPWFEDARNRVYDLYIQKIQSEIAAVHFPRAKVLIDNAARYAGDLALLESEMNNLQQAIQQRKSTPRVVEYRKVEPAPPVVKAEEKKRLDAFNLALANVNQQLQCQSRLDMRELGVAVRKLRSVDSSRYLSIQNGLIDRLANCIMHISRKSPERALEAKKSALRIFEQNQKIAAIYIKPRDACDLSMAGLGSRGQRAICKDKLNGAGYGPQLVVVPATKGMQAFAIGKYELSVDEFNRFCKMSRKCAPLSASNNDAPATNIPVNLINQYLRWLSEETRQRYRLPTYTEWEYASRGRQSRVDPNRNCRIDSRGISKGQGLVKTSTGQQNDWGLVNYAGNARELVYTKGRKLAASGGSYIDNISDCTTKHLVMHDGNPDDMTGFRVLREIKEN